MDSAKSYGYGYGQEYGVVMKKKMEGLNGDRE